MSISKGRPSASSKAKKPKQKARDNLYDQKVKEATQFMLIQRGNAVFDEALSELRAGDFEAPFLLVIDDLEEKLLRIFGRAYQPKLHMVLTDIVEQYGAQREESEATIWSETPASIRRRRDRPRAVRPPRSRLRGAAA